jgi:hypothetical protein
MYTVFLCASCGFYIIFNFFYLSGCFSRERGCCSLVDARYCSSALLQSLRTRAHFHFRSSPHFRRPSLLLFFSNEQFLFRLVSSRRLTSNFHYQSFNCPVPQYHPTIPVLLLTLQGVKSPLLLSSMFFSCVIIALFVRTVARASFELSGNNRFPLLAALPHAFAPHTLPSSHPHTFSRKFHTYKHIHLFSPHTPRLYHQQQMSNEKKNPLSHRRCT